MDRVDRLIIIIVVSSLVNFCVGQQWTIESPTIEYQGLKLILDYTISSNVKEDDVSVAMFQDDTFTESISNENDFLKPSLVVDGSSGTQKVVKKKECCFEYIMDTHLLFIYRSDAGYRDL
jgi:hypothetical protein